jgi:hypothetical protein
VRYHEVHYVCVMIRIISCFAALVTASVSTTILHANAPTTVTSPGTEGALPSEIQRKSLELAKLQAPSERIQKQVAFMVDNTLRKSLSKDPVFVDLEVEYPGIVDAVVQGLRSPMLRAYDAKLPLLWDKMAALYTANLTPADMDAVVAFASSPAGKRYAEALERNASMTATFEAARTAGTNDATVSAAAKREQIAMINKANSEITSADRIAIFRFENSVAGTKLVKMIQKMQDIQLEWDFYFTDEQRAEFADARTTAAREYMAKIDAQKSASAR